MTASWASPSFRGQRAALAIQREMIAPTASQGTGKVIARPESFPTNNTVAILG